MTRKYVRISTTFLIAAALIAGCDKQSPARPDTDSIQVITTIFPLYDFTRQIGGNKVDVTLLLPPGVEAHSYSPTPREQVQISHADLFIYTGPFMEPWVADLPTGIDSPNLNVLDISSRIDLSETAPGDPCPHCDHDHTPQDSDTHDHKHEHEQGHDHAHEQDSHQKSHNIDPHIWVDPILARQMVQAIADTLTALSPENNALFTANAQAYIAKLDQLDRDIRAALAKCKHQTIAYGGHFAFGYFARRYGLDFVSPYQGVSPNSQARPQATARLIETIKNMDIKAIFYEELIQPKMAEVIAEETGVEMLLLHGAHNVSKSEFEKGVTYLDIMRGNLERLKIGLEYTP